MSAEPEKDEIVYCFPDTCILLHFTMFDEIDWPTVLGAPSVCLLIAPIVVKELNAHKDDSHNDRRQQRARDVIRKLEKALPDDPSEASRVRDHVTIRDIGHEPRAGWHEWSLDPQVQDDRLIATILEFREQNPSANMCLITDDVALRLKARHHGVRTIDPEDRIAPLPFAASAVEIENQKLKQQVQALIQRAPKLNFGFWENGTLVVKIERTLPPQRAGAFTDEALAQELDRLRAKHEAAAQKGRGRVSDHEIREYIKAYEAYLQQYELAKKMHRSRNYGPECWVTFALRNSGSAPANDVDLWITFPEGAFVVGEDDRPRWGDVRMPHEPTAEWMRPPEPPDPFGARALSSLSASALIPRSNTAPPPRERRGPLYDFEGDRRVIEFADAKTSQDSLWRMPTVIAYLPPDVKRGFAIDYSMRADELPSVVTGKLHVVWKQK